MAGQCSWEVVKHSSVGSDHYPIICQVGIGNCEVPACALERWKFSKANWSLFQTLSEQGINQINKNQDIDHFNDNVRVIIGAANQTIGWRAGRKRRKLVPWWTPECTEVVKCRFQIFFFF